jgi:succinoglycan biosynthesis protein ExoA
LWGLGRSEELRASLVRTGIQRGIRPLRAVGEDFRRPALPARLPARDAADACRSAREREETRVDVSVLVPVRNEEKRINETVTAMQAQQFDGDVEFLFVDGRSDDRTREILERRAREDPRLRVLDNPARHTAAGLNVGLRHAAGRFIARMDGHTFYPPHYLSRGVERLEQGGVEWVSGPQVPYGTDRWSRRVALALESPLGRGGSRKWGCRGASARTEGAETDLDTGVFVGIMRRSKLEELGGWNEGWPVNQDSELAARVLEKGGRIVSIPALAARYVPRDSLPSLARQYWRYGLYRAKTARHHPSSVRRSQLLPPGLIAAIITGAATPRPLRTLGRFACAAYAVALGVTSGRHLARGHGRDGAALPAVLMTMHTAWGLGFLAGSIRFGPPIAAVASATRSGRDSGGAQH